MIEIEGKNYVKIGNKLAEVSHIVDGQPILKTRSVEKHYPSGRVDCTVIVECLQISAKKE